MNIRLQPLFVSGCGTPTRVQRTWPAVGQSGREHGQYPGNGDIASAKGHIRVDRIASFVSIPTTSVHYTSGTISLGPFDISYCFES
jgi:hypothetical protein